MIRFRIFPALIALTCIVPDTVFCQATSKEILDRFFELYLEEGSDKAIDYVYSTNKWMIRNGEVIENIKTRLGKATSILGTYYGYEPIEEKQLGSNFARYTFLLRYDRQPIKFTFTLYRPNDRWQVHNLKFDDQLEDDLDDRIDISGSSDQQKIEEPGE